MMHVCWLSSPVNSSLPFKVSLIENEVVTNRYLNKKQTKNKTSEINANKNNQTKSYLNKDN